MPIHTNTESEYIQNVYSLEFGRGQEHWISDIPIEEIVISDDLCDGMRLVKMSGNSMDPVIRDGAIFAVDYSVSGFSSGQVFVVWIPQEGPVVRRAFIDLENLILRADNRAYPDILIPACEMSVNKILLGRVEWVLQKI
jgi:phage repressor protein C with HTH and peptisase S24 domain